MLKMISGLALAALVASPAIADDKKDDKPKGEKLICRTIGDSASRLGNKRECRTKEQWDRLATETGDALRDVSGQPR